MKSNSRTTPSSISEEIWNLLPVCYPSCSICYQADKFRKRYPSPGSYRVHESIDGAFREGRHRDHQGLHLDIPTGMSHTVRVADGQEYQSDPSGKWKSKDTAIYLLTSIASRGSTQQVRSSTSRGMQLTFSSELRPQITSSTSLNSLERMSFPIYRLHLDRSTQSLPSTPLNSCTPSEAK